MQHTAPRAALVAVSALLGLQSSAAGQCSATTLPATGAAGERVGTSVALDGDLLAIGAPGTPGGVTPAGGAGAVLLLRETAGAFVSEALLVPQDVQGSGLGPGFDLGDDFGMSAAASGDRVLAGAPGEDTFGADAGAAYTFVRTPGGWVEEQKLLAFDGVGGGAFSPGDRFGSAVALDGSRLAVGAANRDEAALDTGAVYLFEHTPTQGWVTMAKLVAPDGAGSAAIFQIADQLGWSVALSADTVVAGAHGADAGAVDTGAAYVWTGSGATWTLEQKLVPSDVPAGGYFGTAVAVEGDLAVVGAPGVDNEGAAYVFQRSGTTWSEVARLAPPTLTDSDEFGASVAIHQGRVAVGAPGEDIPGLSNQAGALWVFANGPLGWQLESRLVAASVTSGVELGESVALSANRVIGGSPLDDGFGADSGAMLLFDANTPGCPAGIEKLGSVISAANGGEQGWLYSSGGAHPGALYVVLGSLSGTVPGTPAGAVNLPLNVDGYFWYTLTAANVGPLQGTLGIHSSAGFAAASLVVPGGLPASFVGVQAHHAFVLLDLATGNVVHVSPAVSLVFGT